MNKNIIFYFTGTGNSFKTAKDIAAELQNCDVVSMREPYQLVGNYERIGFVFPSYSLSPPPHVKAFVQSLSNIKETTAYTFVVATYGNSAANCFAPIDKILKETGMALQYGASLRMVLNYIIMGDMEADPSSKLAESEKALQPIIQDIKEKKTNQIPKNNPIMNRVSRIYTSTLPNKDKGFVVSDTCISCESCAKMCPVKNIEMLDGKPIFLHHCAQCMACIQWCPKKAINYKDKTENRRRYHNPGITIGEMIGGVKK